MFGQIAVEAGSAFFPKRWYQAGLDQADSRIAQKYHQSRLHNSHLTDTA
jgi:hypothetical protein